MRRVLLLLLLLLLLVVVVVVDLVLGSSRQKPISSLAGRLRYVVVAKTGLAQLGESAQDLGLVWLAGCSTHC